MQLKGSSQKEQVSTFETPEIGICGGFIHHLNNKELKVR